MEQEDTIPETITEADISENSAEKDIFEAWKELSGQESEPETKTVAVQGLAEPEGEGATEEAPPDEAQEIPAEAKAPEPQEPQEQIDPPSTWTAKGKEWFNTLPLEGKREFAKRASDLERHSRKVWQEAASIRHRFGDVEEAVKPFEDELGLKNVPLGQVVKSFLHAERYMNHDLRGALDWLARSKGYTLEQVMGMQPAQGGLSYQQAPDPALTDLQNRLAWMESELRQREQSSQNEALKSIVAEYHAVRDERNPQGQYLYPELHDETFVQSLQPIMEGLRQAEPNLNPRDLLRRAYAARTGRPIHSASSAQQRTEANLRHSEGAKRAQLSARGTPKATAAPAKREVPDDVEETVRQAAEELGLI